MVRFAAAAFATAILVLGQSVHGGQILMLEFSSPTCGPCRQIEPLIHSFQQAGYPIRKVDTSQEPELARNYNITRVPCMVMLVDGQEISRTIGAVDSNQLQQLFQKAREVVIAGQQRKELHPVATRPQPELAGQQPTAFALDPRSLHSPAAAPPTEFAELLEATVRLRVEDGQFRSFGTGTIIDARQGEALVITCGHLFRDSKGKGPITIEMFEVAAGGLRPIGKVSGWVLSYDLDRDVALVVMRPGRQVTVAPIAPPGTAIARGDRAVCVGCSNGDDPTAILTRITTLDRYQGPPNIQASGAPVEGRSGGGLFNDKGELIGICNTADYEGNEGLYAALESIHDEVARLNLLSNNASLAENSASPAEAIGPRGSSQGLQPLARGQNELPNGFLQPDATAVSPVAANAAGPSGAPIGLNPAEQATWEEIMSRTASSEVIIIIRPKDPAAESEMFRIDSASPELIRALESRQRDASTRGLH